MLFKLQLFNSNWKAAADLVNETIEKIREGNADLRDAFIAQNKPYIKKTLCRILKKYKYDENTDEFSIGLLAFNEAIEEYDLHRRGDFYKYSYLLMYHRIIDYKRKVKKNSRTIPFSSIENSKSFEEKYLMFDSYYQYEKIEIKEEILFFKERLSEFGISMDMLVTSSPKHKDSRSLCVKIAQAIIGNKNIHDQLLRTKKLPRNELANLMNVHRRTIENHRAFIIALCIILGGGYEVLEGFAICFDERRD